MGFGISRDGLGMRKLIAVPGWRVGMGLGADASFEWTEGVTTQEHPNLHCDFWQNDFGYGSNVFLGGWIHGNSESRSHWSACSTLDGVTKKNGLSVGPSISVRHTYEDIPLSVTPNIKRDYEWLRNQLGIVAPKLER